MAKLKYWVALGEHPSFSRDDHYVMQVFFNGQPNTASAGLFPLYVEAESLEAARSKLHAFIDERINHEIHMRGIDKKIEIKQAKRDAFAAQPVIADSDINQLTIGEFVGAKIVEPRSDTEGVLNLEDLL